MANGKEDSCVDVQHKKRGRPRLRDEREERYEGMGSAYSHAPEAGMRRPLPLYSSTDAAMGTSFGDPLQRSGSYRILKSQGGQAAPRYMDPASSTDANLFGGPIVPAPLILPSQEPLCAYLTMEMQIAKVAQSFTEAVDFPVLVTKNLQDLVPGNDRERLVRLQRIFEDERRQREPNYLPPIYNFQEDRVIQSVGFGPDEIGHVRLDHLENLTFQSPDGQQRTLQGRFGLSKKDSTYFIVLVLHVPTARHPYPQTSLSPYLAYSREPYSREPQYGYQAPQQPYPQSQQPPSFMANPALADPRGDPMAYRPPGPPGPNIHPPASMPPFSQPQIRSDYAQNQNPYQTPRSELPMGQARQHDLQLPPIRDQRSEGPSAEPGRRRDDRRSRVDIGGLLETPRSAGGR
ncbi:uncharacterized protein BP5553_04313 [Venustampulla echinocandica]|uniref:Uncharacterized protein n=1 Tax=Venustampulla echinocandica TaxID=2656787 RepID=A0A370TWS3_9HELO|nr:uncharacterized protein BP5553_04313 [Venustampulla echinocandica]RDL39973.1 hypothetical protein BP5553_04313 [Venustampulla echinocandica]